MGEVAFEREILSRLSHMEKRLDYIMSYIEDSKLSADDKKALKIAFREEKKGKLQGKNRVFG